MLGAFNESQRGLIVGFSGLSHLNLFLNDDLKMMAFMTPVILCGGSGSGCSTRLWSRSRKHFSKQFDLALLEVRSGSYLGEDDIVQGRYCAI